MSSSERLPFVLTAYGLPHRMGYLPTLQGEPHPAPLDPLTLMDAAMELDLAGIEIPLPSHEVIYPTDLRAQLEARSLKVVIDTHCLLEIEAPDYIQMLRAAARAGSRVVRSLLSRILCGDRRGLSTSWDDYLNSIVDRLRPVLPVASDLGLCIAVENHQDATTEDLLDLAERLDYHPAFGIAFDTGNPLSLCQDPVDAARRLAPIIRHVHLKDYTIHLAPEGYRLVRCAAGAGVVDFPSILRIVAANGYDLSPGIEIAAQATRTIPLLAPGWWDCHAPRDARDLLPVLQMLWERGRPREEPYSSAWERGEPSEVVAAEEWDQVTRSVRYFAAACQGE